MPNSCCPFCLKDQVLISSPSVRATSSSRMVFTCPSNNCSTSAVVEAVVGLYSPSTMLNSGSVRMVRPHCGISATCVARRPSVIDFSCGCHPNWASFTRSRTFRVTAISWSNSGTNASTIAMPQLLGPD